MQTLEDFRGQPVLLRDKSTGETIMPLILAAGMITGGDATGGKEMIAVVRMNTGEAYFWPAHTKVEPTSQFYIFDDKGARSALGIHSTFESAEGMARRNINSGYDKVLHVKEIVQFTRFGRCETITAHTGGPVTTKSHVVGEQSPELIEPRRVTGQRYDDLGEGWR